MWNVESTIADYVPHYLVKDELTLSALVIFSLNHIITYQEVFEYTDLYLISPDFRLSADVENLNKN